MPSLSGKGQAASDGIDTHAKEHAYQRIGEERRHESQSDEPQSRSHLRDDDALAIVDILKPGAKQIRHQLNDVEHRRNQGQAGYRQLIFTVKRHEQQRREVGYDGLRHKAEVAGRFCLAVILYRAHFDGYFAAKLRPFLRFHKLSVQKSPQTPNRAPQASALSKIFRTFVIG